MVSAGAPDVRAAVPADLDVLVPLFQDMAKHYRMHVLDAATTAERIAGALFGKRPFAELILARDSERALGFVSFNTSFPAMALGRRVLVEDLYVCGDRRGEGLGLRLLRAAAKRAEELGASELSWTTERSNEAAQRFYERLGARRRDDKLVYRIDSAALLSTAAEIGT